MDRYFGASTNIADRHGRSHGAKALGYGALAPQYYWMREIGERARADAELKRHVGPARVGAGGFRAVAVAARSFLGTLSASIKWPASPRRALAD